MRFTLPKIKVNDRLFQFKLILREDRAILIGCMGIALFFWVLTKLSQTYQTDKSVTFSLLIPSEMTFSEAPPTNMSAVIEGVGWDLMFDFFNSRNVLLRYDLRQSDRLDLNRVQLRAAILNTFSSNEIKIIELLNHEEIHLTLEEKLQKKVPIQILGEYKVANDYKFRTPPLLNPDSVNLTGPKSKLDSIKYWPTDSLALSEIKNEETIEVILANAPKEILLDVANTNITFNVEQLTERSLFVPIVILNGPENVSTFPKRIRITGTVGLSQYDTITSDDFSLVVDLKDAPFQGGRNTMPIILQKYPDFVTNIIFSPPSVEYFIVEPQKDSIQVNNQ